MTTQNSQSFLFVRKQHTLHRVNFKDINYIRAEGNYCYLQTMDDRKYACKISMRQLLQSLPEERFIRVHKSYVMNVDFLVKVDTKERQVYLTNEVLPIGRTFISGLTERMLIL